jgi:putative membrane protein
MKNFPSYLVIGLFTALFGTSCGSNSSPDSTQAAKDSNMTKMDSTGTDTSGAGKMASVPPTVSKADQDFVVNTANAGMTEIKAATIARQQGTDADVKKYAALMIKDHTAAADALKLVAAKKNLTLPADISPEMQQNVANLQKKTGKDFDMTYMKMMVDDHKKVISAFESESKNGSDADIRAFADNTLHTLRHHLDEAQKCEKMMSKM